jgi:hypothetical protein
MFLPHTATLLADPFEKLAIPPTEVPALPTVHESDLPAIVLKSIVSLPTSPLVVPKKKRKSPPELHTNAKCSHSFAFAPKVEEELFLVWPSAPCTNTPIELSFATKLNKSVLVVAFELLQLKIGTNMSLMFSHLK